MSVTFTMFILWYAGVAGVHWSFVLIGLGADLGNYILKKIIGIRVNEDEPILRG